MPKSTLLLSSRFYAYVQGTRPWGLPNHLWSDAPHMLILFDHLMCDRNALEAERLASQELGWVMSGLFQRLEKEGVLLGIETQPLVCRAPKPPTHAQVPQLDSYYAAHVQSQLAIPIFDWEGRTAKTATTLAPSATALRKAKPGSAHALVKLDYLWQVIANPFQVVPPLTALSGAAAAAHVSLRKLEKPYWRELERGTMDQPTYVQRLTRFKALYKSIDDPVRKGAQARLDKLLKLRDKTTQERESLAPLILEASDDTKDVAAFVVAVQKELARKVPSLFPAVATGTGKCLLGMATIAAPWLLKMLGHPVPVPDATGVGPGITLSTSGASDIRKRLSERRRANPLRFMIGKARRLR
jgi:hypothetical protein